MDIQKIAVEEFKAGHGFAPQFVPAQISETPVRAIRGIKIKADFLNFAPIYIGHDKSVSVSNNIGYRLDPGESVVIEIDSLDKIWVIGLGNTQEYSYLVV